MGFFDGAAYAVALVLVCVMVCEILARRISRAIVGYGLLVASLVFGVIYHVAGAIIAIGFTSSFGYGWGYPGAVGIFLLLVVVYFFINYFLGIKAARHLPKDPNQDL